MIPFLDLKRAHRVLRTELLAALERVVTGSQFILGQEGRALETELAALSGVGHAVGTGSGTDALRFALGAVGVKPGDEVVTSAFSFVASATTITMLGATPVFADVDHTTFNIDPKAVERVLSPRTRAIVAVHLYGQPAALDALVVLARSHGLALIEDAAQAVGASYTGRPVGSWGDATCLSFYPTKNLGAGGDGGMVLTDREEIAQAIRRLRHHGDAHRYDHVELGYCSRLDEMQAALLRVKLPHLAAWTERRRRIASRYHAALGGLPLELPVEQPPAHHVYHLFTVRHPRRDALARALGELGVGTAIHYPRAVPEQPVYGLDGRRWPEAWRAAREVLSLPCFPELTDDEVETVVQAVRGACARS